MLGTEPRNPTYSIWLSNWTFRSTLLHLRNHRTRVRKQMLHRSSIPFDRVWTEGLIYKLSRTGIPSYLQAIIKSFLQKRTFSVSIKGITSRIKSISAGVLQGSILWPNLFNIFMNDIPLNTASEMAMFANYMVIFVQKYQLETAITTLQSIITELQHWYTKCGIPLNIYIKKKYTIAH